MLAPRPKVQIFATGGSIAGIGPHRLDYMLYSELGRKLNIQESLARIPEVQEIARVQAEDLISVGSTSIGPLEWLQMAGRINGAFTEDPAIAGVVVTHGTATLEETAYFLNLTVKSSRPVVVTGAMRPPTAMGTDADLNLLDAVRIAASEEAAGRGVLTVLNNEIQAAREVTKSNTYRVETFRSNELGYLGYADSDGRVVFYRNPVRKHTTDTPFEVSDRNSLPRVDIVYAYAGSDGMLVDAVVEHGADGLVVVGFGGGTFPAQLQEAAARAVEAGILVVMASRATSGRVIMTPAKDQLAFIACDNLLPQKARILLMLALTKTTDRQEIQQMFYEF